MIVIGFPVSSIEFSALFQLIDKGAFIILKQFNLLDDGHIKSISIGIFAVAERAFTAFLELAYISVDRLSICGFPFADLRVHTAAAGAV